MTDRVITMTVTGFTPAGFEIALQILDVKAADLDTAINWFDATALGHSLRPVVGQTKSTNGAAMNENGVPKCALHGVDMERHEKGSSAWYSHKVVGADGKETWCRGK